MERPEEHLAELGAAVAETLAESRGLAEIRLARAGFLERVTARNMAASRPRRFVLALVTAGVAAVSMAAAAGLWAWARLPLTFELGTTLVQGQPGDLILATSASRTPVRFSEGSSLDIHQGGRMRVLTTDRSGARVLLEDGMVDVSITPARLGKKRWTFEAGAFSVHVTGTKFRLSYRAPDQSFGLTMSEGSVVVAGPCLRAPTEVAAGAHVDFSCSAPSEPVVAAPAPSPPPVEQPTAARSRSRHEPNAWRGLLAEGRLQDGLLAAERANFARVCQGATAHELLALADAGRLFGRTARAVDALRVLRERFPRSAEASIAAFSLGRIAFEQKHSYAAAVKWFDTYLREQPSGPLMGDSVGRLMEARLRAGDEGGARLDAEQYLRRFPEGPYASEARGILSR